MARTKLFPGFRFHPTDVELVMYYLKRKSIKKKLYAGVIAEIDIYKYDPWDLPDKSSLQSGDLEWYFFCPKVVKYASGARMNRATESGYWKTTGKDRPIQYNKQTVGMIKTLVFHRGRAPQGDRTDWVMHEYRLEEKDLTDKGIPLDSYVLCKVFQKDGRGPRNGAQYGRPFKEEDWDDDEKEIGVESIFSATMSPPVPVLPATPTSSVTTHMQNFPASGCIGQPSLSCLAGATPSPCLMYPPTHSNQVTLNNNPRVPVDDDILSLLDYFIEDNNPLAFNGNNKTEGSERVAYHGVDNAEGVNDIFAGLGDLDSASLHRGGHVFSFGHIEAFHLPPLDSQYPDFLELYDLYPPLSGQTEHQSRSMSDLENQIFDKGEDKADK